MYFIILEPSKNKTYISRFKCITFEGRVYRFKTEDECLDFYFKQRLIWEQAGYDIHIGYCN